LKGLQVLAERFGITVESGTNEELTARYVISAIGPFVDPKPVDLTRPYRERGVPPRFHRYDAPFLHWLSWAGKTPDFVCDDDLDAMESGDRLRQLYDLVVFPGHTEYETSHVYDVMQRNTDALVAQHLPAMAERMEIIFVEGHSRDDTLAEINRVAASHPELDIKVLVQDGVGKADAVFKGFDQAGGDVLMILDADLTVPPEQLPKFWQALASGKAEFANGSRLVYPLEHESMRFLNHIANRVFSRLFTWLLNQRFTDTLCGTKAISRDNYRRLAANRAFFGDFDPFGDFDLIFGASRLNLKTVEIPIRYQSRAYGSTQISRFRHGLILARMVLFAYRKLKAL